MHFSFLRSLVLGLFSLSLFAALIYSGWPSVKGSVLSTNNRAVIVTEGESKLVEMLPGIDDAATRLWNGKTGTSPNSGTLSGTPPCPIPVLPHNGTATSGAQAPSTRYAFSRGVYLIRATELAAAGYLPGSSPTSISWNYQIAPGIFGAAPLRIYL